MTPLEQYSAWEDRRIYTFTRVRVDEGIAGDLGTGAEAWVVTRGGVVGDVGQHVDGEAVLHVGEPSLLFLRPDAKSPGLYIVTVRGQGQFILQQDEAKIRRVRLGNGIGALVPPRALPEATSGKVAPQSVPGSKSSSATALSDSAKSVLLAHDVLPGKTLQEVSRTVAAAWKRLHAP